jgi:hypothetical protein
MSRRLQREVQPTHPVAPGRYTKLAPTVACLMAWLVSSSSQVHALPVYSRQYNVACSTCHSVPPRLNRFGYAFQANHFNWPGPMPHAKQPPGKYLPITTITTASYSNDITGRQETVDFRSFELFFSSGLAMGKSRQGGFFIDLTAAATGGGTTGDLDDAYVSVPLFGRRGQVALTVGQVTPLLYQYDPVNSLTDTLPYGFSEGVDDFAFAQSTPMIRVDYFDNRGKMSANGNYLSVAVPFRGHLELTRHATIGAGTGIFAHAFHRWGYTTLGALGYVREENNLTGLVGTFAPCDRIFFTGVATLGHQPGLNTSHVALEAEYLPNRRLSLTGRAELIGGDRSDLATVAAVNYYPLSSQFLRLTAESHQRRADRGFDLTVRIQY